MPNLLTGTINASAPTNILVGVASAQAVAANNDRQGLVLVNISGSTMYLGLQGATAVLNSGFTILPNGGTWTMEEYSYSNGQINAIAHSAGNILCIQEFVR